MLLTAELFIELYKQTKKSGKRSLEQQTLQEHNLSEKEWNSYVNFVDDLELNEQGIRIIFDEIRNGHMEIN